MPWADYNVIDTDYDNYAVVYSCTDALFGLVKRDYAWILLRNHYQSDPAYAQKYEQVARDVLTREVPGYDQSQLRKTLHGKDADCKYL